MKLAIIKFADTADPSQLPKGETGISMTNGTNTMSDGEVYGWVDAPDPQIVPHIHNAAISTPVPPPVAP